MLLLLKKTYQINVSNALAYAEYHKNPNCNRRYLELVIDQGFGSAVGVVKNGITLLECELGHTSINMFGKKCDCGNIGCSELYVNERTFNDTKESRVEFYCALASVIANSVNAYNVSQVIFASRVIKDFEDFSKNLQIELEKRNKGEICLTKTVLNGKEVFVACNLVITDNNEF